MDLSRVRRGLFEFGLITMSILLAFSLDAWWDGRSQRADVFNLLDALADELRAAQVELDRGSGIQSDARESQLQMAGLMTRTPTARAGAELLSLDAEAFRTTTVEIPSGVLESLLAFEGWSDIAGLELSVRISEWPAKVDNVVGTDAILFSAVHRLRERVWSLSYLPFAQDPAVAALVEDEFPPNVDAVLSSPQIASDLGWAALIGQIAVDEKTALAQEAGSLIALIELRLGM
jgi:hypothetical protein